MLKYAHNLTKGDIQMKNNAARSVSTLRNIGESRHKAFNRVGVETVLDLAHRGIRHLFAGWLFEHPLNKQAQRLYWEMILDLYLLEITAELALLLTHC